MLLTQVIFCFIMKKQTSGACVTGSGPAGCAATGAEKETEEKIMFDNAGRKIEGLAKFMFWFGLLSGIGLAIFGLADDDDLTIFLQILFVLIGIIDAILAYPISLLIYGFGQLVDDTHATRRAASVPTSAGVSRTSAADNDLPEL